MGFHISGFNILIGNEAGDGGQLKDMMQSDVNETIKFLNEIHELTKEFSANDTLDRYIYYLDTLLGSRSWYGIITKRPGAGSDNGFKLKIKIYSAALQSTVILYGAKVSKW